VFAMFTSDRLQASHNRGGLLQGAACINVQQTTTRTTTTTTHFIPVCVELIRVVEHVESGNVAGWSRNDCFLLDGRREMLFSCRVKKGSTLARAPISQMHFYSSNEMFGAYLCLGEECDLRGASSQVQDPHCLLGIGIQVT